MNENDSSKLNLLSGYTRDAAEEELGWDATIVDVVEFTSKRDRRAFMYQDNQIFNPRTGNTREDLIKGVQDAIHEKSVENTEDDILDFLKEIASDKPEKDHVSIYKAVRKNISQYDNMVPFDGPRANKKLKELGLQYQGRKNKNVSGIAYARPQGYSKSVFWDGLEIAKEMSLDGHFETITIYGYIENPKPTELQADRKKWLKDFELMNNKIRDIIAYSTGTDVSKVSYKSPFVFGGFLPQDITKISLGKLREVGLVDEYGNPFIAK